MGDNLFEYDFQPSSIESCILRRVQGRYTTDKEFRTTCQIMLTPQHRPVSLRVLDWLVTNYSKRLALRISVPDGPAVYVHDAYRTALTAFRRRNFDPFCRVPCSAERTVSSYSYVSVPMPDGSRTKSCVSQLNFMEWAYRHHVLQYAIRFIDTITADMNAVAAAQRTRKKTGKRERRTELSEAPSARCHAYAIANNIVIA
jgi:hypothetical protein